MIKRLFLILFFVLFLTSNSNASISVNAFVTADDVTIDHLENFRTTVVDAINSADGGLIQAGSIPATALDADANPHNRWNEAFNDFVYTGLDTPVSASLSSTTPSGTAYINGVRVVKDATAHTYTASKWTFVDLSSTGVYTYQETAIGASEPSTTTNSIRLSRVSTDTSTVLSVRDDRVTQINIAAGSAGSIADTDADTYIKSQQSADEDILRFGLGNTTLATPREVMTLQAVGTANEKLEPTTDNELDLGSSSKKFSRIFVKSVTADNSVNLTETTTPTTAANVGAIYTKDVAGNTELYYRDDSNGTEIQLTSNARLNVSSSNYYSSSDTFVAPASTTTVYLTMCGGGGGGGGGGSASTTGGGGGGGECIINKKYTVTGGNSYSVTVGAGGTGGSAGCGGESNGGTTTFDAFSVSGGTAGTCGNPGAGGAGGGLALNAVTTTGGGDGIVGGNGAAATGNGGGGGGTHYGAGGAGGASGSGTAAVANTGAGGGGGGQTAAATGGNGGSGFVLVIY